MKKASLKKGLLFFLFAVLCVPFAQHCLGLIGSLPLQGDYDAAGDTQFSIKGWMDGSYQEQKNKYLNDNMGLRPDFVRAGIQFDFTLFAKARNKLVGKENYLFYSNYIDAYTGKDFMGYDKIREEVLKMKYIQDRFREENKSFLFMIAGSKVEHHPEYLPDWPDHTKVGPTNRAVYGHYCDSLAVNFIDFNDYLLELKKTNKGPIFSRQGIHWTRYGAMFAVDSIIRFIERDRKIDLPNPEYPKLEHTTVPRGIDNDMGVSLNLPIPIKEDFIYPVISIPRTSTTNTTSAIYVGDSFFWPLLDDSLTHVNHHYEFWHYFLEVLVKKDDNERHLLTEMASYNWRDKLDSTDCVMIVFTSRNLPDANRFVDSVYDYYKQKEYKSLRKSDLVKKHK